MCLLQCLWFHQAVENFVLHCSKRTSLHLFQARFGHSEVFSTLLAVWHGGDLMPIFTVGRTMCSPLHLPDVLLVGLSVKITKQEISAHLFGSWLHAARMDKHQNESSE